MLERERKALSQVRMEHAVECLSAARSLLEVGGYKSAANRSYYAVFHAMRAVLAFDEIDMKRHSGVISEFRRRYIKTEIFETRMSEIRRDRFVPGPLKSAGEFAGIQPAYCTCQTQNRADRLSAWQQSGPDSG